MSTVRFVTSMRLAVPMSGEYRQVLRVPPVPKIQGLLRGSVSAVAILSGLMLLRLSVTSGVGAGATVIGLQSLRLAAAAAVTPVVSVAGVVGFRCELAGSVIAGAMPASPTAQRLDVIGMATAGAITSGALSLDEPVAVGLQGQVTARAAPAGAVQVGLTVGGSVDTASVATGAIAASLSLAAASLPVVAAAGSVAIELPGEVTLSGDVTAGLSAAGAASEYLALAGAMSAACVVEAVASAAIGLAAAVQAAGGMSGAATTSATVSGAIAASATVTGNASETLGLGGAVATTAGAAGAVSRTLAVSSAVGASAAVTGGANVEMGLAGSVSASAAVTGEPASGARPWTPADLVTPAIAIIDATAVTWSGSDFAGLDNSSSGGGSWEPHLGTVTKGTANNGIVPLHLDNASLKLLNQSFDEGSRWFYHVGRYDATHGALFGLDWDTTDGSFVHYPRDSDNSGRTIIPTYGLSGTIFQLEYDEGGRDLHSRFEYVSGNSGSSYGLIDGVERTEYSPNTNPIGASGDKTLYFAASGTTYADEKLSGDSFCAMSGVSIIHADALRLQGWGAWKFGPPGSVEDLVADLPDDHPYKSGPPMFGGDSGGDVGTDLTVWRDAIEAVGDGVKNARALFIGDSTSAGFGSLSSSVSNNDRSASAPTQLAGLIATATGLKASWQNVMANANADYDASAEAYDHRLSIDDGWINSSVHGAAGTTLGGYFFKGTDSSARWNFHPTEDCDTFEIYYVVNPGQSLIPQINLETDLPALDTESALAKAIITTSLGDNTLNIRTSDDEGFIGAVIAYDSAVKEIQILNAGWDGMKVSDLVYAELDWSIPNCIDDYAPDFVGINLGINDMIAGTSETDFKADYQPLIDAAISSGASVALFQPNRITGHDSAEEDVRGWISDLATENNVLLVDLAAALGTYTDANTAGLMRDGVHPNSDGYAIIAQACADVLLS